MTDPWLAPEQRDGLEQLAEDHALDAEARQRVRGCLERLAALQATYIENVAAATSDVAAHVVSEEELSGLHSESRQRAQERGEARGLDGHLLTIDAPSFDSAMASLDDRALRKQLFEARYTRASDRGPRAGRFDNGQTLNDILATRYELAKLLGYRNYAELALRHDVFRDPDDAEAYLLAAHRHTRDAAQAELDALWAFAKEKGVPRGFSNWDLAYYAAWMLRDEQQFDGAQLEPYFALDAVLAGAFALAESLLGIHVRAAPRQADGEAREFTCSAQGQSYGRLRVAPFAAEGQLHGAQLGPWTSGGPTPLLQVRLGLPAAAGGGPQLLQYSAASDVVRTIGEALAWLRVGPELRSAKERHDARLSAQLAGGVLALALADYPSVAGFARHHESGETLPRALFDAQRAALARHENLRAAAALEHTLFDLRIHRDYVPDESNTQLRDQVLDTFMQVRREQSVLPMPYWTRLANTSLHSFAADEAARLWHDTWVEHTSAALLGTPDEGALDGTRLPQLHGALFDVARGPLLERLGALLGHASRRAG